MSLAIARFILYVALVNRQQSIPLADTGLKLT